MKIIYGAKTFTEVGPQGLRQMCDKLFGSYTQRLTQTTAYTSGLRGAVPLTTISGPSGSNPPTEVIPGDEGILTLP